MIGPFHLDELWRHDLSDDDKQTLLTRQIEHDAELIRETLRDKIIAPSDIRLVVSAWANAFLASLSREPTPRGLLLGTTANIDAICRLTQSRLEEAFEQAACVQERLGSGADRTQLEQALTVAAEAKCRASELARVDAFERILSTVESKEHPDQAGTPVQVLGHLLRVLVAGEDPKLNKKPYVTEQCLVDWVERVFSTGQRVVGGASATINNHMAARGVSGAALLTAQFSGELAKLHHPAAQVVRMSDSGHDVERVTACEAGRPSDLTKVHATVEWSGDEKFTILGRPFHAVQTDRVIFRTKQWWDRARECWVTGAGTPGLSACGFGTGAGLKALAQSFPGAILSGLQYVSANDEAAIGRELEALRDHGVRLHVEFSGEPQNAPKLQRLLRGRISSFGIGEELPAVLESLGLQGESGTGAFADYKNGLQLVSTLELERLYIHRATADIILRKRWGPSTDLEGALAQEIAGDLHTKYVAVSWIYGGALGRRVPPFSGLLRREGILDLLQFALESGRKLKLQGAQLEDFVSALASRGYYAPENGDGEFGVAVIPVKWTYGVNNPITTSVGDLSSGFSFAYGGYLK